MVGTTVYIAAETAGLLVVDVSDPAQPIQAGAHQTQELAHGVALAGDYAYIAGRRLQVLNVSEPATAVAVYEIAVRSNELVILGNSA